MWLDCAILSRLSQRLDVHRRDAQGGELLAQLRAVAGGVVGEAQLGEAGVLGHHELKQETSMWLALLYYAIAEDLYGEHWDKLRERNKEIYKQLDETEKSLDEAVRVAVEMEREQFANHAVDIARRAIRLEREACAKDCEPYDLWGSLAAKVIRARGQA